ncbi:MAG: sigma-70 family RNA polymerase sigma factor [Filimonas sp.]|nr:sigma-70 family RNA polymerase sigma factor [Filimonas sp.]
MEEQRPDGIAGKIISEEEFEELFITHYTTLCNIAFQLTNDRNISEDLVQDFFYSFWDAHRNKLFTVSFYVYAYKAVRNKALNHLRDDKQALINDDVNVNDFIQEIWHDDKADKEAKEILLLRLEREIENLPAVRRKIFLMNNKDGLKYKEIAAVLGISVNTVKTQLRLAFSQLRQSFLLLWIIFFIKSLEILHPFFIFCVF